MDQELLQGKKLKKLIIQDPQEGLTQAFSLYGRQVKTICANILAGYGFEDVEEAVSQTFISLWRSIERFSPSRGCSLKSYIYGIARKTALMHRRANPIKGNVLLDEATACQDSSAEEAYLTKREERILHETVAQMDEPARSIFIMKYFYFEKTAAIAQRLGLPYKKVENTLAREKKKLKKLLTERGIER